MGKTAVAVLGATGLVGRKLVAMLEGHPWFEVVALCASPRNAGKAYSDALGGRGLAGSAPPAYSKAMTLRPCEPDFEASIAFSALDSGVAGPIEEDFARAGFVVCSNARNHRLRPDVPLVIPEVNAAHLEIARLQRYGGGMIVTNPNCSTVGLALALAPVHRAFRIERAFVATLQAISGAGYPGLPALAIAGNAIPFIAGEEEKVRSETAKILGDGRRPAEIDIDVHCNRVPVANGHLINVTLELAEDPAVAELKRLWRAFAPLADLGLPSAPRYPIIVREEADRPQPALDTGANGGMSVSVGRIRRERAGVFSFSLLLDNLVRGAAGAALLNSELLQNAFLKSSRNEPDIL